MRLGARMLSRRFVVAILITGVFLGGLLVASRRLGDLCPDSRYCADFSGMRYELPPLQEVTDDDAANAVPDHLLTDHKPSALPSSASPPPPEGSGHGVAVTHEDASAESPTQAPADITGSPVKAPSTEPSTKPPVDTSAAVDGGKAMACAGFPDTSNILLVMKTGASEAFNKIPTQVLTNLKCVDNFLFFSDMKQDVAGYEVHDSLDTVLDGVKDGNPDFDLYDRQGACAVDQATCNKDYDAASQAWSLDKYKNVHMAEKAYAMEPNHDWYLFVDADTYVLWSTMVPWLKTLDPAEKHYLGSAAMYAGFPFGHGGSGYLVSQAAMHEMFAGKDKVGNRWDSKARDSCCGDFVFAFALFNETGVPINNMWPTINGEKPYTLQYSDEQWCQPIATMHHIGSEEVSAFDAFELARGFSEPVRIKDIFNEFVDTQLQDYRLDWDNMSNDVTYLDVTSNEYSDDQINRARTGDDLTEAEKKAHLSFHDCREVCLEYQDCFQFKYHNGICSLSMKFGHGAPAKRWDDMDASERGLSGWIVPRIRAWAADKKDCGKLEWPRMS